MLRSLSLVTRSTVSVSVKAPANPSAALLRSKSLTPPIVPAKTYRNLYTPSPPTNYPIITKKNADPATMEPMQPVEEDILEEPHQHEEHKLLEHDLEEEDFIDRDDDDLLPEEYINPETGERGGPKGYEPTRFGDWAKNGRVSDF